MDSNVLGINAPNVISVGLIFLFWALVFVFASQAWTRWQSNNSGSN